MPVVSTLTKALGLESQDEAYTSSASPYLLLSFSRTGRIGSVAGFGDGREWLNRQMPGLLFFMQWRRRSALPGVVRLSTGRRPRGTGAVPSSRIAPASLGSRNFGGLSACFITSFRRHSMRRLVSTTFFCDFLFVIFSFDFSTFFLHSDCCRHLGNHDKQGFV